MSSCLAKKIKFRLDAQLFKTIAEKKFIFCDHEFSYLCTRTYSIRSFKIWNSICIRQALVDLCPARTKMKINVINLRPRTHIFYLDLSPRRCMGGGSCRDSTEQQWAYSSFMIGPTQSETILRSIQVQGLSCCSFYNIIRINIHLFLTVQRKWKHR